MKPLAVVVCLALLLAGALVWNRERRVNEALARARAQYEALVYQVGSERVLLSQLGGAGIEAHDKAAPERMAKYKAELLEAEARARSIGYFSTPPGVE